jgi:hypothetical protein
VHLFEDLLLLELGGFQVFEQHVFSLAQTVDLLVSLLLLLGQAVLELLLF